MKSGPKPKILANFRTEIQARLVMNVLEECGIQAEMTGALTSQNRCEAPGKVSILVRDSDFIKSKQKLQEFQKEQSNIDWSKVDVGT